MEYSLKRNIPQPIPEEAALFDARPNRRVHPVMLRSSTAVIPSLVLLTALGHVAITAAAAVATCNDVELAADLSLRCAVRVSGLVGRPDPEKSLAPRGERLRLRRAVEARCRATHCKPCLYASVARS